MSTSSPSSTSSSSPAFALALGGGGARGLAHIIVLDALDELGIHTSLISGSSIGAIIGTCYAGGMSARDIRAFFLDLASHKTTIASTLVSARVGRLRDISTLGNPFLFDGQRLLDKFWPTDLARTFEDLQIPLKVVTTDFFDAKTVVFDAGPLLAPVAASMSIPGVFEPVIINGRCLTDGGITNPVPFDILDTSDPVIAVDVVGSVTANGDRSPTGFEILSGTIQVMLNTITREKLKQNPPEIFVRPPVQPLPIMNFLKVKEILAHCEPIKDDVKRQIETIIFGR